MFPTPIHIATIIRVTQLVLRVSDKILLIYNNADKGESSGYRKVGRNQ